MSNRKTVMICDDEVDLLNLFKYALEPTYDVFIVDSGKDCIKKFLEEKHRGKKVDILLLDYKLGDMLGDIVACKVHELNGVKTILTTAYDLDQDMVNDLLNKRCIMGIMKKPIRIPTMIKEMEKVMSSDNFP
jgi:response regulator RpfG family c-di-GMP phosphodiesterase